MHFNIVLLTYLQVLHPSNTTMYEQTIACIHKDIGTSHTTIIMSENNRHSWEYHAVGIIVIIIIIIIIIIIVYYAEAAQYTAAIRQTKNTIYRLGLQNRNFYAITCSINKMFPHARLDSILTKIQRWNVVFGHRLIWQNISCWHAVGPMCIVCDRCGLVGVS